MFVAYNILKTVHAIQSIFGNLLDFISNFHHEKRETIAYIIHEKDIF